MMTLSKQRLGLAVLAAFALDGCSQDVRQTKLENVDLTDMQEVQRIANKLEPDERAAFGMYVMNRTVGSMIVPGQEIVRSDGKAPFTVQEAIDLAKARKAKNDAKKRENEARSKLMDERNALVDRKNNLLGPNYGLPVENKAEWDRLEKEIADFDKRLKTSE